MTFDCGDISRKAKDWATNGDAAFSSESFVAFRTHLENCLSCKAKYGPISTLMTMQETTVDEERSVLFARNLMREILGGKKAGTSVRFRRIPLFVVAAALSVVLFSAGFLAGGIISSRAEKTVEVRFTLEAPHASSVGLVGYFPDSEVGSQTLMTKDEFGKWFVTVELRKDGVYTYSFIVDGSERIPDPAAEEFVDDGFGGRDSLLRL